MGKFHVGVLKTSSSNYRSICRALDYLEAPYSVVERKSELTQVSHIIVPGVSKFESLMKELEKSGFDEALNKAKDSGKAILGLCAGMQIMGRGSEESMGVSGLGWLDFDVIKIEMISQNSVRSFHTGWNEVHSEKANINGCYYFNHSYHVTNCSPRQILGTTFNGRQFASVVGEGNLIGAQFHPEKSQTDGLNFIENFVNTKI